MKFIFAGRDNSFNRKYINELVKDHDLICCLFLEIDRFTFKGRFRKIKKRIQKYGWIRVLDELSFHVWSTFILRTHREKQFMKTKPDYFSNSINLHCPVFEVENINSKKWLDFIKDQKPDVIFSICCNVHFNSTLVSIPRFGAYVLHEGILPEYKGLHSTLWTLLNKEYDYLGYTLFKANNITDGGSIVTQGKYELNKQEGIRSWSWVGHNALIKGLPEIIQAFKRLENEGGFIPLNTEHRKDQYYSWMRMSTFLHRSLANFYSYKN